MVWQWCPNLSAHLIWWQEPLNRSLSSATAPQISISTAPLLTCLHQLHWTSTMAPSPSTKFIQTLGKLAPTETPGTVNLKNWLGTTPCHQFLQVIHCFPQCHQMSPTKLATTTLPALLWKRRRKAASIIQRYEQYHWMYVEINDIQVFQKWRQSSSIDSWW